MSLWSPPWRAWWGMVVLLAFTTGVCALLDEHVLLTSQALLFLLTVVVAAHYLGRRASMLFAVIAVVTFNFFFVPPFHTLSVQDPEFALLLLTMLAVALLVSQLAARARDQAVQARIMAERAGVLQALSVELSQAETEAQVVHLARTVLSHTWSPCLIALIHESTFPLSWTEGAGELQALPQPQVDAMACCIKERAVLGPGTTRWPDLPHWYFPLKGGGAVLGAVCATPPKNASLDVRVHLESLCAVVGQAIWRIRWAESARQAQAQAAQHAMRSTLLAAVSHDLRTPLAAIVGAASVLELQGDRLPSSERCRMLSSIRSEADHLTVVTDNTLQLMRLSGEGVHVQQDWESLEEIVGAVLARIRQRDLSRRIKAHVPADLPLIKADPVLLAQLLDNLLDNALKHGDGTVDLRVGVREGRMALEVKDRGEGIAPEVLAQLGQAFVRGHSSHRQRGSGLGLAVCAAIVRAHQGEFHARRRKGGGSCMTVLLPIHRPQPRGEP